jgi:hypothetical protein
MRGIKRLILLASLAVVLMAGGIGVTRSSIADQETSANNSLHAISNWYDVAWHWRKPITISNAGGVLAEYQVKVTINTQELISAGKMQSDGDDIRFTEADGVTEVPYWIESGIDTDSTVIWVKVPSIPSGDSSIYIYYGNSSAITASDGTATFIFFDDFEDGILDWTVVEGIWSEGSGIVTAQRGSSPEDRVKKDFPDLGNDYIYEYKMRIRDLGGNGYPWGGLEIKSPSTDKPNYDQGYFTTSYSSGGTSQSNMMKLWRADGGISQIGNTANVTVNDNTWYDYKLVYHGGNLEYYINGTLKVSAFDTTYTTGSVIRLIKNNDDATVDWDDVRVRKYSDPEPGVTQVGLEE